MALRITPRLVELRDRYAALRHEMVSLLNEIKSLEIEACKADRSYFKLPPEPVPGDRINKHRKQAEPAKRKRPAWADALGLG